MKIDITALGDDRPRYFDPETGEETRGEPFGEESPDIELIDAANALSAILEGRELHFDEARKRSYYMEPVTVKRWVLGDGGKSGENCETCQENADLGWIDMDATFLSTEGGDIDDVPAHPNDTCSVEYKDTSRRVYV